MMVLLSKSACVNLLLMAVMMQDSRYQGVAAEGKEDVVELKFTIGDVGLFADRLLVYKVEPSKNFTIYDMYDNVRTDPIDLSRQAYPYDHNECDITTPEDYSEFFPDVPVNYTYWTTKKIPVPTKDEAGHSMTRFTQSWMPAQNSTPTLAAKFFYYPFPQQTFGHLLGSLEHQKASERAAAVTVSRTLSTAPAAPGAVTALSTTGSTAADLTGVGEPTSAGRQRAAEISPSTPVSPSLMFTGMPYPAVVQQQQQQRPRRSHRTAADTTFGTEMMYIAPPSEMMKPNTTFCFQLVDKTSGYKALIIFNSRAPPAFTLFPLSLLFSLVLSFTVTYY